MSPYNLSSILEREINMCKDAKEMYAYSKKYSQM